MRVLSFVFLLLLASCTYLDRWTGGTEDGTPENPAADGSFILPVPDEDGAPSPIAAPRERVTASIPLVPVATVGSAQQSQPQGKKSPANKTPDQWPPDQWQGQLSKIFDPDRRIAKTETQWALLWQAVGLPAPLSLPPGKIGIGIFLGAQDTPQLPELIEVAESWKMDMRGDSRLPTETPEMVIRIRTQEALGEGYASPWLIALIPDRGLPIRFEDIGAP